MINVVHAGDHGSAAWNAILYPMQHVNNKNYFQSQMQNISSTLTSAGAQFMQGARAIYEDVNSSATMMAARAALRAATGVFFNQITPVRDINEFQTATPLMQRWIMANPTVRDIYNAQQCDGYSDSYVDTQPGVKGDNHYDYRRVMDAVVYETEEGTFVKTYADDLFEGDRELNHGEKVDILDAWELMDLMLKHQKQDPTSPYGGSL